MTTSTRRLTERQSCL